MSGPVTVAGERDAAAGAAGLGPRDAAGLPDDALCVTNVQRFSLHDGGGIRTVVFAKGCPFRCPWCCNPEGLDPAPQVQLTRRLCIHCSEGPDGTCRRDPAECPTGARRVVGQLRDVASLVREVLSDAPFYEESGGGMTLSGGECLAGGRAQRLALELLGACRRAGVRTAVETTLAVPLLVRPDELAAVCDQFLVDFKVADPGRSLRTCGIDVGLRDRNLRALLAQGAEVVARMPIVPGHTDSRENVEANARRLRELGVARVDVLPFHQLGESKYESLGMSYAMGGVPQLGASDVAWVCDVLRSHGIRAVVHGE